MSAPPRLKTTRFGTEEDAGPAACGRRSGPEGGGVEENGKPSRYTKTAGAHGHAGARAGQRGHVRMSSACPKTLTPEKTHIKQNF